MVSGAGIVLKLAYPRPELSVPTTALLFPYGMTMLGFVLWMWQLSYVNHRFVARFA